MKNKISKKELAKYIKADGQVCPFCGGSVYQGEIECCNPESETPDYLQQVDCDDCGKRWYNVLELKITNISDVIDSDEDSDSDDE